MKHIACLLGGIVAVCVWSASVRAAIPTAPSECAVTIASPQDGEKEGADVMVSGSAVLPPAGHLYVFARRRGLQIWFPQSGAGAEIKHGKYQVLATLGEPRDKGHEFEILAEVVDANENARLEAWFRRAEETGRYPGMPLPPFLAGCGTPPTVVVIKTE